MYVECLSVLDDCVSCIGTRLSSAAQLDAFTEDVNDLAFAFVAPLRAEHDGHWISDVREDEKIRY